MTLIQVDKSLMSWYYCIKLQGEFKVITNEGWCSTDCNGGKQWATADCRLTLNEPRQGPSGNNLRLTEQVSGRWTIGCTKCVVIWLDHILIRYSLVWTVNDRLRHRPTWHTPNIKWKNTRFAGNELPLQPFSYYFTPATPIYNCVMIWKDINSLIMVYKFATTTN